MHRRVRLYHNTCSPSPYQDIACLGCLFIPPPRDLSIIGGFFEDNLDHGFILRRRSPSRLDKFGIAER